MSAVELDTWIGSAIREAQNARRWVDDDPHATRSAIRNAIHDLQKALEFAPVPIIGGKETR